MSRLGRACLLLGPLASWALISGQTTAAAASVPDPRYTQTFDLAAGAGSSAHTGALAWKHLYGFGSARRVKAGFGLRLSSFLGRDDLEYTTADAELIKDGRVNTLTVSSPRTQALNVMIEVKYRLLAGLEAGFDIDVVGFGFGRAATGRYRATDPRLSDLQSGEPSSLSLLKGGSPDRGQLDSEFFLAYWWSPKWGIRAGFSHFLSEYTTASRLDFGNDRFRHSANLGFVGLSYRR